jgi:hypothetical protein
MRIDSAGNVLIGSAEQTVLGGNGPQLQVQTPNAAANIGVIRNTVNSNGPTFLFGKSRAGVAGGFTSVANGDVLGNLVYNGADGTGYVVGAVIAAAVDGTPGTNDMPTRLTFSTTADGASSATERMRITSSGNLLVGTTNASARIHSVAPGGSKPILGQTSSAGLENPSVWCIKFDNNQSSANHFIWFTSNAGANGNGAIAGNGSAQATFITYSDIRLKENIYAIESQLDKIVSLNPCEFDYKSGGHQIGFIAQEVQEIYPDLVSEGADGFLTVAGLGKFEARLIKAIQELKATVDAQAARIAALESK